MQEILYGKNHQFFKNGLNFVDLELIIQWIWKGRITYFCQDTLIEFHNSRASLWPEECTGIRMYRNVQ